MIWDRTPSPDQIYTKEEYDKYFRWKIQRWLDNGLKQQSHWVLEVPRLAVISLMSIKITPHHDAIKMGFYKKYNEDYSDLTSAFTMSTKDLQGFVLDAIYLDQDEANELAKNKTQYLEDLGLI